jgi:protein required for attachment to host cells
MWALSFKSVERHTPKSAFNVPNSCSGNRRVTVERVLEQRNPATHDQGTDRPGRKPGSGGLSQSAIEETDWHQLAEDRFAELIVVAPPKVLGRLRGAMHKEVTDRIIGEIPKELTMHSVPDIEEVLRSLQ